MAHAASRRRCVWQVRLLAVLRQLWPNGRAKEEGSIFHRHDVIKSIAERGRQNHDRTLRHLWGNEHDWEKAISPTGNIRPDHPFMLFLNRAFKAYFGNEEPRAAMRCQSTRQNSTNIFVQIRGSKSSAKPNGWWTTELDEPVVA